MSRKLYVYRWDDRCAADANELGLEYWKMLAFDEHWFVTRLSNYENPSSGVERLCSHLVNLGIMQASELERDWSTQNDLDVLIKIRPFLTTDEKRAFRRCIPWVHKGPFWRYFLFQDAKRFLPALKNCKNCGLIETDWLGPDKDTGRFILAKRDERRWYYQKLVIDESFCSIKCEDKHYAAIAKDRKKWEKGAETLKEIKTLLSRPGRREVSPSQRRG